MTLPEGAFHFRHYLGRDEQASMADRCRSLGSDAAGFYTPVVRGGGKMKVQMVCLGLHWNARTYRYEESRSDWDGLPVQPLPPDLAGLASRIARDAGMAMVPEVCILNYYSGAGRMGLHQDKDEAPETLREGVPVVSVSLGDSAVFLFGGLRRKDPPLHLVLESGDAFVFGGPSRMRYHGVSKILPGTAPGWLQIDGRFNLTFRQFRPWHPPESANRSRLGA